MVLDEGLATKCPGALPPMAHQRGAFTEHDDNLLRVGAARKPVRGVTDDLQDGRPIQGRAVRSDIDIILGRHLRYSGRVLCEPSVVPCRNQRLKCVSHSGL